MAFYINLILLNNLILLFLCKIKISVLGFSQEFITKDAICEIYKNRYVKVNIKGKRRAELAS